MKALWLAEGRLALRDVPPPADAAGESVLKVLKAGICGTDLALARGLYAFEGIPGHEFVARVEHGPRELLGRRVVADINIACQRCAACARRDMHHCSDRRVLGLRGAAGAFAERLAVPARNLFPVHDRIPDDHAVFAEPLAAALAVLDALGPHAGDEALVIGAGRLGQLMVRVLMHAGWRVHCHGRGESALERLPGGVGRSRGERLPRLDYPVVIDTSGSESGLATAMRSVRARGTLVLKSTLASPIEIDLNRLVVDEIRLLGSRCGSMSRALAWLAQEAHDLETLISHRYSLHQGLEAFVTSAESTSCKVVLAP